MLPFAITVTYFGGISMSNGIHDEVRDMLKNSAIDLGEPGFDSTFGYAVWLAPAHCISATAKAKI